MASNDSLPREKKERFIFEQSKLVLSMPKLSLTIPTNQEDENCLTLQAQTDFYMATNSQT